jgi:predicted RNase H-like HicB family nuclease
MAMNGRKSAKPKRAGKTADARLGRIVYERSGRWWVASMPSFPGAYSQGLTQHTAYLNLLAGIKLLIETYQEQARKESRRRARAA